MAKGSCAEISGCEIACGEISRDEIYRGENYEICRGKHITVRISSFQPLQTLKCIILNIEKVVENSIIFVES